METEEENLKELIKQEENAVEEMIT